MEIDIHFHLRPFTETGKSLKDFYSISRDKRRLKGMVAARVILRRFTAAFSVSAFLILWTISRVWFPYIAKDRFGEKSWGMSYRYQPIPQARFLCP